LEKREAKMKSKINTRKQNKIDLKIKEIEIRLNEIDNIEWMVEGVYQNNINDRRTELLAQIDLLKSVK
jgi:hypothetical protein